MLTDKHSSLSNWPKQLYSLDVSRGIAALAVVLWHWQLFAYDGTSLGAEFDRAGQPFFSLFKLFYERGILGVHYFFLLSGFILFWIYQQSIQDREVGFNKFWVFRLSRLYPLHFVTLLIVAVLQVLYINYNDVYFVYGFNDAFDFALNLFFASGWGIAEGWSFNGPAWSVSVEILLYFAFFIVAFLRIGHPLVCLALSIISINLGSYLFDPVTSAFALFFMGGFTFHVVRWVSTKQQKLAWWIIGCAIGLWAFTIADFYVQDLTGEIRRSGRFGRILTSYYHLYLLFPLTVAGLALIEIRRGYLLRRISWVGDISYSSYLLHFPLQLLVMLAASYGLIDSDLYLSPIFLLLFFLVLIVLSYQSYLKFERPCQKWLRDKYSARTAGKNTNR
jgi:peptidoglycan/LPS O-acetylase OafA/YrhL